MTCKNLSNIRKAIGDKDVTLIAVSKGQSIVAMIDAYNEGVCNFGENYLQEALPKIKDFCHSREGGNPVWHYLGRLQSKKLKDIAQYFDYVHSLDRLDHAEKLNTSAQALGKILNVFVQVNLDQEPQKGGVGVGELPEFIKALKPLSSLKVKGLMAIPQPGSDTETLAKFQCLKTLVLELGGNTAGCLSMGMSQDYPLAISAGATHIRVGEALFGKREAKKSLQMQA